MRWTTQAATAALALGLWAALAAPARAQQGWPQDPFFLAAALGRVQYGYECRAPASCDNAGAGMGKLGGGVRFGRWGLEAWWIDFGEAAYQPPNGEQRMRAVTVDMAWYFAPAPNALVLLRAGLANVEQRRSGDASSYRILAPHFGLGLLVPMTPSVALELGWDITEGEALQPPVASRASAFSLGLRLGF